MIQRQRVLAVLLAVCVCLTGSPPAIGQTSPLTTLKTLTTVDATGEQTIRQTVQANLKKLDTNDPAAQTAAREAMISDGVNGSAAYNDKYASVIAAEFAAPAVAQSDNARKRLNAAVALARIASATKSAKLAPAVLAMLDPKQPEPVQLWGLKAVGPILPEAIRLDPQRKPALLTAIVPSIKGRLTSPMANEAYEALKVPPAVSNPSVIDEILNLVDARLALYRSNPQAIDEASVDQIGLANYIMDGQIWGNEKIVTPDRKVRAMQAVCNLIAAAAQNGDIVDAGSPEREQYQILVNRLAGGVFVAASVMQQNSVAQVANKVASDAKPQNAILTAAIGPLCPAIRQLPGFESVQPPAGAGPQ